MRNHSNIIVHLVLLASISFFLTCSLGSHERRGDGYFKKGRYQDALAEYLVANKEEPGSPELLFKIGVTSTRMGDPIMACAYYDTLLAIDSSREEWIINDLFQFAVKSLSEGDTTSMRESFQMILDIDSTYNLGESFYPLARAYKAAGEHDRAVKSYLKALSFAPDSPAAASVVFELAFCYEQIHKYKEAIAYYEEYLKQGELTHRDDAEWHRGSSAYYLAEELFREGNLDEALEYLTLVIMGGQPQVLQIDAWFLSGEIYYAKEDLEKALESYNEVTRLDPSHTMIVTSKSLEMIRKIRYGKRK